MYFYELHEGDDEVFSDLLLFRDEQMEPEDFFELVQAIRRRSSGHVRGKIPSSRRSPSSSSATTGSSRLRRPPEASVNVSPDEKENFLADLDAPEESARFRTVLADFSRGRPPELSERSLGVSG